MGVCMDRVVCIVTEYYPRGSLADVLDDTAIELPWKVRLDIMIGAAKGLLFLHSASMLHRDWKSSNILIASDWSARICDFGCTRRVVEQLLESIHCNSSGDSPQKR